MASCTGCFIHGKPFYLKEGLTDKPVIQTGVSGRRFLENKVKLLFEEKQLTMFVADEVSSKNCNVGIHVSITVNLTSSRYLDVSDDDINTHDFLNII